MEPVHVLLDLDGQLEVNLALEFDLEVLLGGNHDCIKHISTRSSDLFLIRMQLMTGHDNRRIAYENGYQVVDVGNPDSFDNLQSAIRMLRPTFILQL